MITKIYMLFFSPGNRIEQKQMADKFAPSLNMLMQIKLQTASDGCCGKYMLERQQ